MIQNNEKSVNAFIGLLKEYTNAKPFPEKIDFTFFLGAGFSKSWDNAFPLGGELFS